MATTFHIVQRMAPGGIESIVLDLARIDPDVRVVSLEGDVDSLVQSWPPLAALGDRLMALSKPDGIRPALWRTLAGMFRAHEAGAIITHHIGPLVYAGIGAVIAKVARRIHVEHDGWHYAGLKRRILARLIEQVVAPRRVAVSAATATQVANALGTVRQTVIPNGVDLDRFRPASRAEARDRFDLPGNAMIIGCVGRLESVKGQDILLEAFSMMDRKCHLVLAGSGSMRAVLEERVDRLCIRDRVHFLGNVDAPETLYPAFDLFCLPSRSEGFPRSLIEAQASGIRVVASQVGGVAEAVCPASGRLVPPGDPAGLASALQASLDHTSRYSPRAFVDPAFSNALMADRYQALLHS